MVKPSEEYSIEWGFLLSQLRIKGLSKSTTFSTMPAFLGDLRVCKNVEDN